METMSQLSADELVIDKSLTRRSLDLSSLDDIPEERVLSGKSSEEKEMTRVDSGLGEWDSESSRKTSFSSQGRLSPDVGMEKTKESVETSRKTNPRRRRSGIDMMSNKGEMSHSSPVVKTRLPKIAKSSRATGVWSRKISPAGLSYLKMDDEMEEIIRNGKLTMVPRKISDHIPIVPIHSLDRFVVTEWNENLGLDDEDLQIYKTPYSEIYELHNVRWEFFGKLDFRKMMVLALDGEAWVNGMQKLEFMKTLVSEKDQKKMDKMLKQGYSPDEIVQHFMEDAEKKSGSQTLARKMEELTKGKDLTEDEILELMRNEMGEESRKKMDELMKQGHSKQEVMKLMLAGGQLQDEETRDTAGTIKHIMTSKKKNIKMNQDDLKEILDQRLDDDAKAKMKEMLAAGVPLKEVLDSFAKQCEPEQELSEMEKKMRQLTEGQELTNYQIFELMKDQMDAESRKKMDEMVRNGCPLEEVIEHFLKKGKTKEQAQNEKSEELRKLLEKETDLSPDQILELMRSQLGAEDKAQLERMLKNGCSVQEVIDHFVKRGQEPRETEDKTEFQTKIEELLGGKNLSDDEILALIRSQVDDETKAEIKAMLEKGYSKKDVINHLMKNVKTNEEKEKEAAARLLALFDDQAMCEEEKISLLEKQLNNEDKAQMEEMLRRGCSIEEVIGHFMTRSQSPDREKSKFAQTIEKMMEGKNMSVDEVLQMIEEQLDDESKQRLEEMLKKGYTKQDVINYFLKNAKTKEEQMRETADKIKALMNDENMTEENKLEILRNQLSKEDLAQMEEMLKDGGSLEDVMQQMLKSKSTESLAETELSRVIHQMMGERQLSNGEILDLIKNQIDEAGQAELQNMLMQGFSEQEVIDHFLTHGKTLTEKQRETSEKLQAMLKDSNLSPEETISLLQTALDEADKVQMERMLSRGCSVEEVVAHFSNRGIKASSEETELAVRVRQLSQGKILTQDQILGLIQGELSEESRQAMEEMLKKGYSKQDVINHFMNNGKTVEEEHKEVSRKLSILINSDSMSSDEMEAILRDQLSPSDKKIMEKMLNQGKSVKEIVKHFIERIDICPKESEIAIKIKKISGGRKLSHEEMFELLKDQLGEQSKKEMERMLAEGVSMEAVIEHFLSHGKTTEEEEIAVAERLLNLMNSSLSEEELKQLLSAELPDRDKKIMEEMLKQGYSMEEVLEHFQSRCADPDAKTELAKKIKKISGGRKLSNEDLIELIKDQLSETGKDQMEQMLREGKTAQEVIDYFLNNGKTQEEENREIGAKLCSLVKNRKLSQEELFDLMSQELNQTDKAQMEKMLSHGCSLEEVLHLFINRGITPDLPQTELARRVKKLSKGKILSKKEILHLIKYQLTEERKSELEAMLLRGYKIDDVIEHYMIRGKTSDEEFREVASRLEDLIDVNTMSDSKIIEIMNSVLGAFDKMQVEDMLRRGCSTPELVNFLFNRGKVPGQKTEFAARMERLLDGKCLPPQDILDIMKQNLDEDSRDCIVTLLEKGYTVQDVIEHLLKTGKTPEQKQKEVAEKMLQLLDSDMSEEQVLKMMRAQLGAAGCKELDEMLQRGCSLNEIIDNFLQKPSELEPREEETEFAKKIKQLMGEQSLDPDQMLSLIKSELDPNSQCQLEEMLRCGCSKNEVIQHFMTREKNKKGQKRNEFGRKIYELTKGKKLTKKELLCLMKNYLDEESLIKMDEMIKKGYPIEDVIDYFLKSGKTPEQALREKNLMKEKMKKETAKKIHKMIEGNNLSNEEILAILKLQMGDEDRQQLDVMLKKGCSTQEIIEHFMNRDVSDEETHEKTMFEKKMEELMDGKSLSDEQILDMMKHELDNDSVAQMEQMLQKGYTKEDVIKYFMKHGDDRNDFVQEMKKITEGSDLSKEEILDIMKKKLGVMSQRKMEDMLREGYSAEEIIQHLMTHGKTQEQETSIFTRRMSILLDGPLRTLTDKEKVDKLKENLGKEAASMLEELLKNGLTAKHVLDLFLKHGNDVNSLVGDSFFIREISFPNEPEDASAHQHRDVFSVIDKEEAKKRITYMSPSGKTHIFGLFFEMVLDVVSDKGLTHREIMDLMRFRMGAGYAQEFDDLRKKGLTLQQIVDYFLKRDEETLAESRLVAKLKAEARVDKRVYLKREYSKEKWGVSLTYTFSKNQGLHLILDDVVEFGPAWESGVRKGDVIVTVNDWLIVLMDRAQVAAHLFQAGANIVKLGIQKTNTTSSPEQLLGVY